MITQPNNQRGPDRALELSAIPGCQRLGSDQSYDTLAHNLYSQLSQNPNEDLIFIRTIVPENHYVAYALEGHQDHFPLTNFVFVDAGSVKNIADYLLANLRKDSLPDEIRIVRAAHKKSNLALFLAR